MGFEAGLFLDMFQVDLLGLHLGRSKERKKSILGILYNNGFYIGWDR